MQRVRSGGIGELLGLKSQAGDGEVRGTPNNVACRGGARGRGAGKTRTPGHMQGGGGGGGGGGGVEVVLLQVKGGGVGGGHRWGGMGGGDAAGGDGGGGGGGGGGIVVAVVAAVAAGLPGVACHTSGLQFDALRKE